VFGGLGGMTGSRSASLYFSVFLACTSASSG
jgi:hypothetical protein